MDGGVDMKKKKWTLLILCVIMCVFFIKSLWGNVPRVGIIQYVKENNNELESFSADIIKNNQSDLKTTYHGWDVCYWKDACMMEFQVTSWGLGSSACYTGFYYTPNDSLLGFQGTKAGFVKDGNSWKWEEQYGDNKEYLKKITDHWYWYKMYF